MKLYGKLIQRGFLIRRLLNPSSPQNYMASFCVSTREFASSSVFKSGSLPAVYGRLNSSPFSQFDSGNLSFLKGQRRNMFIQTKNTPNPDSLMFCPGQPVMEVGSADFPNSRSAMNSPLAKALYGVDGVTRVFYGSEFVTVTKSDDISWDLLKPQVFAEIMDFYSSGKPLFIDAETAASKDTAIHEDDSETVAMIKELLETRIRPAVQDDGGDIEYCGFDPETGIVKLTLQGACSGCPSSSVTLKSGIENMLMHYVPEVRGVEQAMDDADTDNEDETGTSQSDTAGKDDTVESQMAPGMSAKSHSA